MDRTKLIINRAVCKNSDGCFELVTPFIYQFEISDSETGISMVSAWFHSEIESEINNRVRKFLLNLKLFLSYDVEQRETEFRSILVKSNNSVEQSHPPAERFELK